MQPNQFGVVDIASQDDAIRDSQLCHVTLEIAHQPTFSAGEHQWHWTTAGLDISRISLHEKALVFPGFDGADAQPKFADVKGFQRSNRYAARGRIVKAGAGMDDAHTITREVRKQLKVMCPRILRDRHHPVRSNGGAKHAIETADPVDLGRPL